MKNIRPLSIFLLATFLGSGVLVAQAANDTAGVSDQVKSALQDLRQAKQEFLQARQEAAQSNTNTSTEDRHAAEQKRMEQRQQTLLKVIDLYLKHLDQTKTRVEQMPNISDDQKNQALGTIAKAVDNVTALRDQVAQAASDTALKSLAQNIRAELQQYQSVVKSIVEAIHTSRFDALLSQANDRATGLNDRLAELQSNGQDVASLQTTLATAQDALTQAAAQAGTGDLQTAIKTVKSAYASMREVLQGIKSLTNTNS